MNTKFFGWDPGMSGQKLWGEEGGVHVLSQVALNGSSHLSGTVLGMNKKRRPMEIRSDFGSFYVGEGAHGQGDPVQNLAFDRLTGTSEIRSLLYAALTNYQREHGRFPDGAELSLIVGLPFQMMAGEDAEMFKSAVRKWVSGEHAWSADGEQYRVSIDVPSKGLVPQSLAMLYDFALDMNGELIASRGDAFLKECGQISIGFKTIEFMVTKRRSDQGRFTGGVEMGVSQLLRNIRSQTNNAWTYGELDEQLRLGDLDVKKFLPIYADGVTGAINDRWKESFTRFAYVLVAGGGAVLLQDYLTAKFKGKAIVLDNPLMAISRGLYKIALKYRK